VTPTTVDFVYGHFYTSAGGNGTTFPYIKLKPFNSLDSIIIWVDNTTSYLMAKMDIVSAGATTFAFGLCIEYGPRRKT